jgi:hypothetical protein
MFDGDDLRSWARPALATALSALAIMGAAACGDSDDEGGSGGADASPAADASGGTPLEQIKASHEAFRQAVADKDYKAGCEQFSRKLQKEFGGGGGTCAAGLEQFVSQYSIKKVPATVRTAKVNGDKARVVIKDKDAVGRVPFVIEGGSWKMDGGFGTGS